MENRSEGIGELLLSRLPRPANLAAYEEEVKSVLAKNEKKLRQDKWTTVRVWIFIAAVSAPFLWMAATHFNTPHSPASGSFLVRLKLQNMSAIRAGWSF